MIVMRHSTNNSYGFVDPFMDLEKAYDTTDRYGMWQMRRVYGVGGKFMKAVQSFYVDGSKFSWNVTNG